MLAGRDQAQRHCSCGGTPGSLRWRSLRNPSPAVSFGAGFSGKNLQTSGRVIHCSRPPSSTVGDSFGAAPRTSWIRWLGTVRLWRLESFSKVTTPDSTFFTRNELYWQAGTIGRILSGELARI